jgi:hypothetical protein
MRGRDVLRQKNKRARAARVRRRKKTAQRLVVGRAGPVPAARVNRTGDFDVCERTTRRDLGGVAGAKATWSAAMEKLFFSKET